MVERGAYLTGTTFVKPTIFEIVAKESLASTLEPAFKKIFTFLVTCNAERYGWLQSWSDEAYLIFNGLLEDFYLKNYAALFSETFYGLKRIGISNGNVRGKLSTKQAKLSLLLVILAPYLKSKAQKYEEEDIDGKLCKERWKSILKVYFVKAHKIFHFIHELSAIYYYLIYISDYSAFPTPSLHFLSTTLTYAHPSEIISISELLYKWKRGNFHLSDTANLIRRGLMTGLEFGAFFLQFINWWNKENYNTSLMSLPVPPPPEIPVDAEKYRGICPVCYKKPSIPTALAVSGYLFCYRCILHELQIHGRCPVTNYPAKEDDLIRVYIN